MQRFGCFLPRIASRSDLLQRSSLLQSFIGSKRLCSTDVIFDVETVDEFTEKVINSTIPVIVDFHAEWCGPCRTLGPRLEAKVYGRDGAVLMAKVNVDQAGELAMNYGVTAVPTVMSFKNGELVEIFNGRLDDEIDRFIDDTIKH